MATAVAFAQDGHGEPAGGGSGIDVVPVAAWTFAGICASGLILGVFYLLKRRLGMFAHPSWIAPITIMPSSQNADEGTFGAAGDGHGHASAGHH